MFDVVDACIVYVLICLTVTHHKLICGVWLISYFVTVAGCLLTHTYLYIIVFH